MEGFLIFFYNFCEILIMTIGYRLLSHCVILRIFTKNFTSASIVIQFVFFAIAGSP